MIQYSVSDGVCILRLDAPPLNTITLALLDDLRAAVRRANEEPAAGGIVIAGDANHFSAGADIGLFRDIRTPDDAVRISRIFQQAFQEIEDSAKPVVAAVAGRMMGSALELAAACHVRVCTRQTVFSMPEVNLGINPGAGGTQRLPRLIGLPAALKMLLTAAPLAAAQALDLGLVDAVCEGHELEETARRLLKAGSMPRRTRQQTAKIADTAANAAAFAEAEASIAAVRPEIIAPRKIIEAVRTGIEQSFAAGLLKEQQVFAECMETTATRNKIYLFFATRETGKLPQVAAAPLATIAKTAVVGMGTMGTGIVQALIAAGLPVVVRDESEAALQKGLARIGDSLQKRVAQGKLTPGECEKTLALVATTADWSALAGADMVIESVFEDIDAKRAVIAQLEKVCTPGAIIASNTSTISLDALAAGMAHPERLVGLHFFNPAQRMPLVEVIRREGTADAVVAATVQLAKRLRKTPVLVRNREGFLVNRLFVPYLKEAFWLLEEGIEPAVIDRAMTEFGFAMGPLALIDMAGLDILAFCDRVLRAAFPRHGPLPAVAARLVERGLLGQKSGAGVYSYAPGDYTPRFSETTRQIVAEMQRETGGKTGPVPVLSEITDRLVLRMVCEAFWVIEEGIAQRDSDLDVAMVLGTGFPDFRGGPLRYARDFGEQRVLQRLDELAEKYGERFAVPDGCRMED